MSQFQPIVMSFAATLYYLSYVTVSEPVACQNITLTGPP